MKKMKLFIWSPVISLKILIVLPFLMFLWLGLVLPAVIIGYPLDGRWKTLDDLVDKYGKLIFPIIGFPYGWILDSALPWCFREIILYSDWMPDARRRFEKKEN